MLDKVTDTLVLNYGFAGVLLALNVCLVVFVGRWAFKLIGQQRTDFLRALKNQQEVFLTALKRFAPEEHEATSGQQ